MITLRAHFDGHVFIPDEPVHLAPGADLELHFREVPKETHDVQTDPSRVTIGVDPVSGLPVFRLPPGSPKLTIDHVRRAEEDEF